MMRSFIYAVALALAISPAQAATTSAQTQITELLARYDCCGRLEHSEISKVGQIRSGGRLFTIYTLWFVNPQSRHGMKRLIVVEGERFHGSYIISSWAKPVLRNGVVVFICDDGAMCEGDNFAIIDGEIPSRLWVDGEVNQLDNTI